MKARLIFVSVLLLALVLASCAPAATTTPTEQPMPVEPTTAITGAEGTEAPTEAATEAATEAPEATEAPAAGDDPCATDEFGCATIPAGETVKIGMGAPMTGDNAAFGVDISQGAMIAVEDGGDVEGFEFELVVQDDGGTPEGGAAVANKLVSDPTIVAIAGHVFSGATDAAMPIYEEAGIPMMSPSATNPPLTQKGSKVFNRVAFTDAAQGKFAAEYMYNTLGFTRIAVMHDGQAYGKGLADVVAARFAELGGEVVDTQAITPNETDYTAPLAAIASKDPEALYFGGYVQEGVVLVNQMDQSGLNDVVFFGCDGTYGADFISRGGENAEGAYSAVAPVPEASDAVTKFNEAYETQFGAEPGALSPYSWNAYDSAATLIHAIKSVAFLGDDGSLIIPRGELVAAVRGLKDYEGLSGMLSCDEVGECNTSAPVFLIVKDGEWVEAAK